MGSCPLSFCSRLLKCKPRTALYITRVRRKTCSISSDFGTRPSSSRRATAILALRSRFFCSALVGVCRGAMVILTSIVSKLIEEVKYCDIDFVTGFITQAYAHLPRISGVLRGCNKKGRFCDEERRVS